MRWDKIQLNEEKQITAARTKQHEKGKHTGIYMDNDGEEKERKQRWVKKQENRTKRVDSKKASRRCYKAEQGLCQTICHLLPTLVDNGIKCRHSTDWYQACMYYDTYLFIISLYIGTYQGYCIVVVFLCHPTICKMNEFQLWSLMNIHPRKEE